MKYLIQFTEMAKSDLRDIALYIVEQSKDKEVAKRFVKEIAEQCTILELFPLIGALPKDRALISFGYRFLMHKEYLIFYSIDENNKRVFINAIFNEKKDYTMFLRRLT